MPVFLSVSLGLSLVGVPGISSLSHSLGEEPKERKPPAQPAPKAAPSKTVQGAQATKAAQAAPKVDPELSRDPLYQEFLKINYVFNRELYELCVPRYEKLLESRPASSLSSQIHYALGLCHYNLAAKQKGGEAGRPAARDVVSPEGPSGSSSDRASDVASGAAAAGGVGEHLREAVLHLKEAIKDRQFPTKVAATLTLGQALFLSGEPGSAAAAFQWVLDRKPAAPDAATALSGLADARYSQGEYSKAAEAYRQVLQGKAGAERERTEFYLAMSLWKGAEGAAAGSEGSVKGSATAGSGADLKECAEIFDRLAARADSPLASEALYMSALLKQKMGDVEGSLADFGRLAAAENGDDAELGRFGRAAALARSGRHAEAVEEWRRLLAEHPKSPRRSQASLYLARSLIETGQLEPAAAILAELEGSSRSGADKAAGDERGVGDEVALTLARLHGRESRPRDAIRVLEAALASFPRSPLRETLRIELVTAQAAAGDLEAAQAGLDRLVKEKVRARDQVEYLGCFVLHRARAYDKSLEACDAFLAEHQGSPFLGEVLQIRAENLFLAGRYGEAREAYSQYLSRLSKELDPRSRMRAGFRVAQALYLEKKYDEARAAFSALRGGAETATATDADKILREDQTLATCDYLLGDCAYQLKDYGSAAKALSRFLLLVKSLDDSQAAPLADEARDARFKLAHSLQLDGKADEAVESYKEALSKDPETPHRTQIQFELGQIAYAKKDFGGARAAFASVVEGDASPRFAPPALRFLGWMAFEKGDYRAAAAHYRGIVEKYPESEYAAEAEYELASSLQAAGDVAEAATVLRRFEEKHPGDPRLARALLREAESLSRDGRFEEALAVLKKLREAQEAAKILPNVLYEMAWCHRGLKDLDAAAKAYEEILGLPDAGVVGATARLEFAEIEFERREYSRAKGLLEPIAGGTDATAEKALYRLCWCHHLLGEHDLTRAAYERFKSGFPQSALLEELALLAGKALFDMGKPSAAAQVFRSVASGPPERESTQVAVVSLGECLAEEKKFEEAREHFRKFLEKSASSQLASRARFGLAWTLENLGKTEAALAAYREVVEESSSATAARAQFQIGQCLASLGKYQDAIVEFLQVPASYRYPEWSSRALLQAAGCFETLGDRENAMKHFREVLGTYPDRDEAKLARERLERLEKE